MSRKPKTNKSQQKHSATKSNNGRSNKSTSQSQRSKNNDADRAVEAAADNDVSWYAHNPEMIKAAASLPFSQSLGSSMTIPKVGPMDAFESKSFPGLMVMRYVPSPVFPSYAPMGSAEAANYRDAAINIAANGIYTTIRSHNSGGKNYDPPNLMLYLLAMDNVYAFWSWMTRLYGCIKVYSQRNRYLPEMLVTGNGVNYDDLVGRLAEFRYYINLFAAKASSLCVPAVMDYYQRHFWLCQNIFADDQTLKAQMYMFVPACFFCYNPISKPTGAAATPALEAEFPIDQDTAYTLNDIKAFGDKMLRSIITDEEMNIMSGDILKAFGESALFKLVPIPEEHLVLPVYSEEVLTQIHNAHVAGIESPQYAVLSQQDYSKNKHINNRIYEAIDQQSQTGYLVSGCTASFSWEKVQAGTITPTSASPMDNGLSLAPYQSLHLLNLHRDDVDPSDVMIATRLRPAVRYGEYTSGSKTYQAMELLATGSEWIANATIYRFSWENGVRQVSKTPFQTGANPTAAEVATYAIFQQHPIVPIVSIKGTAAAPTGYVLQEYLGDIDNYTFVDNSTLQRIHETAVLSQFSVPLLGAF